MSSDPVRITFSDMTHLYTMGDGWSVRCLRLFHTQEEAQEAYGNEWEGIVNPNHEEQKFADTDDGEDVEIETTYGSVDRTFREMDTFVCRASKKHKIITVGPNYPAIDYGYGDEIYTGLSL